MLFFGDEFFWFIAIGSCILVVIEYQAYSAWTRAPFAVIGLALAIIIGYSI
jgi:peptidoglycan/LPS O-acetylase OafA/YrhL